MPILLLAFLVTLADQVTKFYVRAHFYPGESSPVINGFFDFTYVRNTGAAWGMMGGQNILLAVLSIIMLVLMAVFRKSILTGHRLMPWAYGLLVGGILGNFIDRVKLGYVTDFLDFYVGSYHWPVFNIADSAICIGVFLYVLTSFQSDKQPAVEDAPSAAGEA